MRVEDARIFSESTGNPMKKTTKQANPPSPKKTKQMTAIDKTAKKNIKAMELVVR